MDVVINMPVFLTIPSCLTFFEFAESIWVFLDRMIGSQQECNSSWGEDRQMGKKVHRMLRMEGVEAVYEQRLQNCDWGLFGGKIVRSAIKLNITQGMNLERLE
ncbi:hypothetical protein BLNAU_20265 [Blattamonas nauphoetae]|uniref:Uncharacterized protein n=1 Tax=Blattamonas nauphoetae TaxID=2049346 RepID=A0ABQ9WZ64_9EUKA|nr:hypothetical protein BLNAU_20265 [Blattamonas nauphoetae]